MIDDNIAFAIAKGKIYNIVAQLHMRQTWGAMNGHESHEADMRSNEAEAGWPQIERNLTEVMNRIFW